MREKYGMAWKDSVTDVSIELCMYRISPAGPARTQYFTNALKMLFPPIMPNGKRGHLWNEWTERRVKAWCEDEFKKGDCLFQTWFGPSSAGKSTDAAAIVLAHWFSAADDTTVIVCTTTADMLDLKVWGEIERLYMLLGEGYPGRIYKGNRLVLGDENSKNGIFGVAVQRGDPIGIHNKYNCLVIDEMQDEILMGAADSIDNLSTGEEFRFLGMGNPQSHFDPLGKYSEPVVGWKNINVDADAWQTKEGKCLHFDGEKSPAIKDPEKFYFLIKQVDLDKMKRRRGKDSPRYWSFGRGFIPPEGMADTLFTENFLMKFQCMKTADWKFVAGTFLAIDPSYSMGGDACVAQVFQVGETMDGEWCLGFLEPEDIHLELSEGEPLVYFLVDKIQKLCERLSIMPEHIASDTSGVQGMFVDVLEKKMGKGVFRVNFQGKASDLPVSVEDPRRANEVYANRVTELWSRLWEYCHAGQVRGLAVETVKQLCSRQFDSRKGNRYECLEAKKVTKGRYGRSPDNGDAAAVAASFCRERLGIIPGGKFGMEYDAEEYQQQKDMDLESRQDLFLTSDI